MSTPIDLNALQERLGGLASLDELRFPARSPDEREVWERSALVRGFDEELYGGVLAKGLAAPTFADFVGRNGVEPVARGGGEYQLTEAARRAYRGRKMPDVIERLLAFYRKRLPESSIEVLTQLVVVDPAGAAAEFRAMYDAADREFDMSRCSALLRALDDRAEYLGRELQELREEYQRYFDARNLFTEDYYLSSVYTKRLEIEDRFVHFLSDRDHWIFHLHAPGGYGKTTSICWLIARHALMPERRYPCTRLDFNLINSRAVGLYPALFVLPLAEQLDAQLPGMPFFTLIQETRQFSAALWRTGVTDRSPPEVRGLDNVPSVDLVDRFIRGLKESAANLVEAATGKPKPVLIVLDTLEELILSRSEALLGFLGWFERAREAVPQLRLILSGRYDLRERMPEFARRFAPVTTDCELWPFTKEEGVAYLRQRGLKQEDALLSAIWSRAESGLPYLMSWFAELGLRRGEGLTEEEVRKFPHPNYVYLLDRVVGRIEPELQWMLRYGIIPRRLSKAFLRDVLFGIAVSAQSPQSTIDRPREHWPDDAGDFPDDAWKPADLGRFDPDELFARLKNYAGVRGWVSVSNRSGDELQFHPNVLRSMRELLRGQPVFGELHGRAARYFEAEADQAGVRWSEATAEAIYHRFQLDGPRVAAYWRAKLNAPQARAGAEARLRIAEEILGPDYADEDEPDLPRLEPSVLAEAHAQAARACVALAQESDVHYWLVAKDHVERIAAGSGEDAGTRALAALLNAHELEEAGTFDEAVLMLRGALETATGDDRLAIEVELGNCLALLKDPEAIVHYQAALVMRGEAWGISEFEIRKNIVVSYQAAGEFDKSERLLGELLAEVDATGNQARLAELIVRSGELKLSGGDFREAERRFVDALGRPDISPVDRFWAARGRAEVALALRRPLDALRLQAEAAPPPDNAVCEAAAHERRGAILGRLLQVAEAVRLLEHAEKLYGEIGALGAVVRCQIEQIDLMLHGLGDLRTAGRLVETARQGRDAEHSPLKLSLDLFHLEWLWRRGDIDAARRSWAELQGRDWVRRSAQYLAQLIAHGLAFGLCEDPARAIEDLASALPRIGTPTVRLATLRALIYARTPLALDRRQQIVLTDPLPRPSDEPDDLPSALLFLEACRVFGLRDMAESLVAHIEADCRRRREGFALAEALAAHDRIRGDWARVLPDLSSLTESYGAYPVLLGAAFVQQAERAVNAGHLEAAAEPLELSLNALKQVPEPLTKWHARARELAGRLRPASAGSGGADQARGAYEAYIRLGRDRDAERAMSRPGGEAPMPPISSVSSTSSEVEVDSPTAGEPRYRLYVRHADRSFLVEAFSGGMRVFRLEVEESVGGGDVPASLHGISARLADDPQATTRLATGLLPPLAEIVSSQDGAPHDLRLEIEGRLADAIPWELLISAHAAPSGLPIRFVYRSESRVIPSREPPPPSGLLASITRPFARPSREAQQPETPAPDPTGSPRRVLILEPSQSRSYRSKRGREGGVKGAYQHRGVEATVLDNPTPRAIIEMLEKWEPTLLHIVATLQESPSGKVYLDFAAERGIDLGSADEALSASLLHSVLAAVPRERPRPPVLLDVPRPPTSSELVRQLLLRNAFAAELYATGMVSSVLATGLADPYEYDEFLHDLVSHLSDGSRLGDIVAWAHRRPWSLNLVAHQDLTAASALFTADPTRLPLA